MTTVKAAACVIALTAATATAAVLAAPGKAAGQATTLKRVQVAPLLKITGGSRLGISVSEVDDADAKTARLSAPAGAHIDEVSEGSAAEKAGMRKGDVIVEFDGERVRSARQLTRVVQETPGGRKVTAVVMRDGQRVSLTVEPRDQDGIFEGLTGLPNWARDFSYDLRARPVPPATPAPRATPPSAFRFDDLLGRASTRLGITVDSLSPQLAEYFGTKAGVLVTSVRDDSAAAKFGLRAGDVITSVNGSTIDDPAELRRRLQSINEGEEFTLGIMRDKKAQTLKGKLEQTTRRRTYRSIV